MSKELYGVLPFIVLFSLGGCDQAREALGIKPPMSEWPVVIEMRDNRAVAIPVSPDLASDPKFVGSLYDRESDEFEMARIMANCDAEADRMDAVGYEAGLAGEPGVVPRPLSCAGENAWRAAWKRGRRDGGHYSP